MGDVEWWRARDAAVLTVCPRRLPRYKSLGLVCHPVGMPQESAMMEWFHVEELASVFRALLLGLARLHVVTDVSACRACVSLIGSCVPLSTVRLGAVMRVVFLLFLPF